MKNNIKKVTLSILATAVVTSCQTVPYQGQARDVKLKPNDSGLIALPLNPRPEDRSVAERKMIQNCGAGKYKILEEGEIVVGQKTNSSTREDNRDRDKQQVGSFLGLPVYSGDAGGKNISNSSTTENVKEWQIAYNCLTKTNTKK